MLFRRPVPRFGRPSLLGTAARTAVIAGTATAVSGSVARHQQARAAEAADARAYQQQQQAAAYAPPQPVYQAPPPPAAEPAGPAPLGPDVIKELQQLATLKDSGVLTDEEFAQAKARLLGS